jgi:hypothetical protein
MKFIELRSNGIFQEARMDVEVKRGRRKRRPSIKAPASERIAYGIPEAGALIGLGRNSAYAAAKAGEIPTVKIGSRLFVPKARFHALFELGAVEAETSAA